MAKKGKLEEILSKARFSDDPNLYSIFYRDFETIKILSLPKFLKVSKSFKEIPATRIEIIKKVDQVIYQRYKKPLKK